MDGKQDLLTYASALVSALRLERDRERAAHLQTAECSQARIGQLQAMLARREAELGQYAPGGLRFSSMQPDLPDRPRRSNEVGSATFNVAITQTKALEEEIQMLAEKASFSSDCTLESLSNHQEQLEHGSLAPSTSSQVTLADTASDLSPLKPSELLPKLPMFGDSIADFGCAGVPIASQAMSDVTTEASSSFQTDSYFPSSSTSWPTTLTTDSHVQRMLPLNFSEALDTLAHEIDCLKDQIHELVTEKDRLRAIVVSMVSSIDV